MIRSISPYHAVLGQEHAWLPDELRDWGLLMGLQMDDQDELCGV